MTNKEAKEKLYIEWQKFLEDNIDYAGISEAYKMAFKALEQESKTVIYSGDGYADGYMVYDMAECPSCGYEYEDGDKDWGLSFCPNCGQALNWERSDKE